MGIYKASYSAANNYYLDVVCYVSSAAVAMYMYLHYVCSEVIDLWYLVCSLMRIVC